VAHHVLAIERDPPPGGDLGDQPAADLVLSVGTLDAKRIAAILELDSDRDPVDAVLAILANAPGQLGSRV
jgi:hypothetical protein